MFMIIRLCIAAALLLFMSCSQNKNDINKIYVTTTLAPYADVIKQIGGDKILVDILVEPGQNAHTFELTPQKLKSLENSKIYFAVGNFFSLEKAILIKTKDFNKNLLIINTAKGIQIKNNNPHVWLSPKLMMKISDNIVESLISIDKENENYYRKNFLAFNKKLEHEDSLMSEMVKSKVQKIFVVYHAAWEYFANDYGLKEIAIEDKGKTPQMKSMKNKIKQLIQLRIKTIFADPQFNPHAAETIAKSINANLDYLNPLPLDYLKNLAVIREKLEKGMN